MIRRSVSRASIGGKGNRENAMAKRSPGLGMVVLLLLLVLLIGSTRSEVY